MSKERKRTDYTSLSGNETMGINRILRMCRNTNREQKLSQYICINYQVFGIKGR